MKIKFNFLIILGASLLCACSSGLKEQITREDLALNWQEMEQKLQKVSVFSEQGRIGFISAKDRGSCNYEFILQGNNSSLELISPIGSQIAYLQVTKDSSALNYNNTIYKESNADLLLNRVLGLNLSYSELRKILLGIPSGEISRNKEGKIISATIDGYNIHYVSFKTYNGFTIPTDIDIKGYGRNIKLKVNTVNEVE